MLYNGTRGILATLDGAVVIKPGIRVLNTVIRLIGNLSNRKQVGISNSV